MKEQLRPTIPNDTPWQLANLIRLCWKDSPSERPSFFQIVRRLKQMLAEFEEDEAEKRRLRVEYERELNIAGSSLPSGGGGGGMLGKSIRKIGRGLGELREDLGGGSISSADLSPRVSGSHEGEELVLKVNPLMRIRKMTLANFTTDDLDATTTATTSTPLRASSKPGGGLRRKLSIGSALGQNEKEKDSVVRSSGKPGRP
jgi:hypothetical protein